MGEIKVVWKMLRWEKLKWSGKSGKFVEIMVIVGWAKCRGRGKCVSHGYRWERNG